MAQEHNDGLADPETIDPQSLVKAKIQGKPTADRTLRRLVDKGFSMGDLPSVSKQISGSSNHYQLFLYRRS
jgi:hypothetical protein